MKQSILYLDLETSKKGKIGDIGALFGEREFHKNDLGKLTEWIKETEFICGHNIIAHDISILKKRIGEEVFKGKKIIDTLLWSPILFVKRPNHKLTKGYRIVNASETNNPLSDCKLTEDYLIKELNRFNELDEEIKSVYWHLLKDDPNFNVFFELARYNDPEQEETKIEELMALDMCSDVDLEFYSDQYPVELTYVFTLLKSGDDDAVLPPWVRMEYPKAEQIINDIRFESCGNSSCNYCSTKLDPQKALLNYFGYSNFRKFDEHRSKSLQEEAVRAGLQNKSFVAVFPTGGGKSLTFQLPALMRGESTRHLTLIISPLVSLMKDQVDNLMNKEITNAVSINGLLSPLERQEAFERVEDGRANLLYISPESLRSPSIYNLILSRSLGRVVIDEAHCFSSWGQDFRVDYLFIADFIRKIEKEKNASSIPVSCFTATAKPQVIIDIKNYFRERLDLELDEYITSKGRTNLSYEVINVEDPDRKMAFLLPILNECEKPAIIYASRTKQVEKVCAQINAQDGMSATYFHGQMKTDEKKANMEAFMAEEKDIIVATSAFGMGVDKDNVKSVIHYNISDSLENYVQESGRAGRDENIQAKCYILYSEEDLNKHFSLLQQTKLNHKEIKGIWKAIKDLSKNRDKLSNSALEIARKSGWDAELRDLETKVKTAISTLEDQGFLKRSLNSPRVFADSLLVKSFQSGQEILKASKEITQRDKKECATVLKRIITDEETRVDYLAVITELSTKRVQDAVRMLRDLKILGDAKDLTAFVSLLQSRNGSKKILEAYLKTEKGILAQIQTEKLKIPLRELNQRLLDNGIAESNVEHIRTLLTYWDKRRFVKKKRIDKERDIYEVDFIQLDNLKEDVQDRHDLALSTFGVLEELAKSNKDHKGKKDEVPVSFSLLELIRSNQILGVQVEENSKKYERALLYLNDIKAIKLEGGFMVSYNKLNISEVDKSKSVFTKDNYAKMEEFYLHKTEQIHIVGEYAKKCIENYTSALAYVNDYFTQDYEEFLAKYFPRKKTEIRRSITPKRFAEIIGDLDIDQTMVFNDNKSDRILVYAGPGSGKTKVLVHKIASLLLIENIKPEQFMMLTFSKAAAIEFKERIRKLVPEYAGLIKITTFHGFCFQLLGQLGDLDKSQNVIQDCIEAINKNEIDITSIENKSILMFDEFQDINYQEWDLIKLIITKAENPRVIAVGDDDQNIYGFRGSSNAHLSQFRKDYNATLFTLPKNYRSYSEIIDFNNHVLSHLKNRLKDQRLVANNTHSKGSVSLIKYEGKYLEKPLVQYLDRVDLKGSQAVLTRTNMQALLASSMLKELGYKVRLAAGFEGFRVSDLYEMRCFGDHLRKEVGESGIILETHWELSIDWFTDNFKKSAHYYTCISLIRKYDNANPEKKLMVDWWEYCREINMEDAVRGDSDVIVVSTMHKAKGKEYDHVYMLIEDYDYTSSESRRLLYVASTRAKKTLHIHTNGKFYDNIESKGLRKEIYEGELNEPTKYEMILNHKDVSLSSQDYPNPRKVLKSIQTGDALEKDIKVFDENKVPGLKKPKEGNLMLFSRKFISQKYEPMTAKGFEIVGANVEYIVYWYNKDDGQEYKIVLPKLVYSKS